MPGYYESQLGDALLPQAPEEKLRVRENVRRLKTLAEYFESFSEAVQQTDLASALSAVSPWLEAGAEALKESVAPIKFVAKMLEGVGRVDDPLLLGHLACTSAYQRAFEIAVSRNSELGELTVTASEDFRPPNEVDVAVMNGFTLRGALSHAFVENADRELEHFFKYGLNLDDPVLLRRLEWEIHNRFVLELRLLLSHRSSRERFDPFWRWLSQDAGSADAFAALQTHAEHQSWLFHERPVLDSEAFALAHIYQPLDCGDMSWQQLTEPTKQGKIPDPFDEQNGERQPLLDTVLRWIEDPEFDDALMIQGSAGSGKSTFSLRLCSELDRLALRPIRVELKNLPDTPSGSDVMGAFSRAVELSDPKRDASVQQRYRGALLSPELFDDLVQVGEHRALISRYVLILDGWDELSMSASVGYQERLGQVLRWVRDEFLRNRPRGRVRVLLIGRPTSVMDRIQFMMPATRILTVRPLTADQLEALVQRFVKRTASPMIAAPPGNMPWNLEGLDEPLTQLVDRFREGLEQTKQAQQSHDRANRLDVMGQPLLIHLTLRLLAAEPGIAGKLLNDATALYRSMVDLVVGAGGKADHSAHERVQQYVIVGNELRDLLRDTAAAMQALGVRDLPRDELIGRLDTTWEKLSARLDALTREQVLSRLMISFFFKGGHSELGCAFSHMSFREYLYAEKVVECLKHYGRDAPDSLPLRVENGNNRYWQDFDERDPRHGLFRSLAELLGPQWLNAEEVKHLKSLLYWELERSFFEDPYPQSPDDAQTELLEADQWIQVRDGLADLWDAWGEGVHLRALPINKGHGRVEKTWPISLEVAEMSLTIEERNSVSMPKRIHTIDGHFGDGLFRLTAWIHGWIWKFAKRKPSKSQTIRCYQVLDTDEISVQFAPSGLDTAQFKVYCSRINSAGYRPGGFFPSSTDLHAVSLLAISLQGADLQRADLQYANLQRANLQRADLQHANLQRADLQHAILYDADLQHANLQHANLQRADLQHADLYGANLHDANLHDAKLK